MSKNKKPKIEEAVQEEAENLDQAKPTEKTEEYVPLVSDPKTFQDFHLSEPTLKAIESMGFKEPTLIQKKSIPAGMQGWDIIGKAKTGSGKSIGFLIPIIERLYSLKFKTRNGLGALVLSPTRELAIQLFNVLRELCTHHSFTFGLVMGGANRNGEVTKLNKGVNILIATPGRLLDHLQVYLKFEL